MPRIKMEKLQVECVIFALRKILWRTGGKYFNYGEEIGEKALEKERPNF